MSPQAAQATEKPARKKADKKANCVACNKVVKRLKRYYRDGKYYCSKKCWRAHINKSKSEEPK